MATHVLEIKEMSFRYNKENYIFNNFNLNIKKNDFVYLIGTNNSGKTTLINILKGYPYDGEIYINGVEFNSKNKSLVCKYMNIIDKESVNKCKLINIIDKIKEISNEKYGTYLKDYNTLNINNNEYVKLSFLDKIKALIFINLINDYSLLVIDELIDMLDSKDKDIMYKLLKKYQRINKKTILLISNNADGIIYTKRTLILDKGIICFDSTIKNVEKSDNIFNELSIKLPFVVDLSIKLKLYDLIDEIYIDEKRMIKDIWKK